MTVVLRAMLWLVAALWLAGDPLHRNAFGATAPDAWSGPDSHPLVPKPTDRHDAVALVESRDEVSAQPLVEPTGGEPAALRPVAEPSSTEPPSWRPTPRSALTGQGRDSPYSPRAPPAVAV